MIVIHFVFDRGRTKWWRTKCHGQNGLGLGLGLGYHFVHSILSGTFCPLPFCPSTNLTVMSKNWGNHFSVFPFRFLDKLDLLLITTTGTRHVVPQASQVVFLTLCLAENCLIK